MARKAIEQAAAELYHHLWPAPSLEEFTELFAAELEALLSAPVVSPPQGVTPQSEILAWLNIEQRKAERWAFSPHGVYRFAMTGPELMRIRHALGAVASEWQCRFVAEDARCCQLAKEHDGDHRFVTEENSCL